LYSEVKRFVFEIQQRVFILQLDKSYKGTTALNAAAATDDGQERQVEE
jgi:hypothetical protein